MRRRLAIVALVPLLGPSPARAAGVPVAVIEGRGHGHGVGMAQDGALWMGRGGSTTAQILNQFYPGTTVGRAGGEVRVGVLTAASNAVVLRFPNGGEVRDAREGAQSPGFPVRVGPGGQARLRFDGRQYLVDTAGGGGTALGPAGGPAAAGGGALVAAAAGPGAVGGLGGGGGGFAAAQQDAPTTTAPVPTTTTTAPGLGLLPRPGAPLLPLPTGPLLPVPTVPALTTTTTAAPPAAAQPTSPPGRASSGRSLWAAASGGGTIEVAERGARYRGVIQALGGSPLRLVNHVDVEQYLRGMGEVRDPSWPAASLRAQAIAARTYALRAVAGGGELCDTQQCQVYLGAQAEYAAMDRAVSATRGQVLVFHRSLAATVYSANGGGFSASPDEGFGTPGAGYPYLRPARYPTRDPQPWTVTVSVRDLGARVGYRGRVAGVRTQAGPSGRVVRVTVEGSAGVRTVSGIDFHRALGLRSTMFTVRMGEAAAPPPPPPADGGPVQDLPGDPAAVPGDVGAVVAAAADSDAAAGAPTTDLALSAPEVAAASAASKIALGALAWLLLVATSGGAVATHLGWRRADRPPPPT